MWKPSCQRAECVIIWRRRIKHEHDQMAVFGGQSRKIWDGLTCWRASCHQHAVVSWRQSQLEEPDAVGDMHVGEFLWRQSRPCQVPDFDLDGVGSRAATWVECDEDFSC